MLPEVTARIRPPRALAVPYPLGYPLGAPQDHELQLSIVRRMLELCSGQTVPAVERFACV